MNNIPFHNQKTTGMEGAPQIAFNLYLCSKMEAWALVSLFRCLVIIWLSCRLAPDLLTRSLAARSFPLYPSRESLGEPGGHRVVWLIAVSLWLSWWGWVCRCWKTGSTKPPFTQQHLFTETNLILSFPLTCKMAAWGNLLWLWMNSKKNYKSLLLFSSPCIVWQPTSEEG